MKVLKLELYVEPVVAQPTIPPTLLNIWEQPIYQMPSYADNYAFYNYPNTIDQFNPWEAEMQRIEYLKYQYMLQQVCQTAMVVYNRPDLRE